MQYSQKISARKIQLDGRDHSFNGRNTVWYKPVEVPHLNKDSKMTFRQTIKTSLNPSEFPPEHSFKTIDRSRKINDIYTSSVVLRTSSQQPVFKGASNRFYQKNLESQRFPESKSHHTRKRKLMLQQDSMKRSPTNHITHKSKTIRDQFLHGLLLLDIK